MNIFWINKHFFLKNLHVHNLSIVVLPYIHIVLYGKCFYIVAHFNVYLCYSVRKNWSLAKVTSNIKSTKINKEGQQTKKTMSVNQNKKKEIFFRPLGSEKAAVRSTLPPSAAAGARLQTTPQVVSLERQHSEDFVPPSLPPPLPTRPLHHQGHMTRRRRVGAQNLLLR